MPLTSSTVGSFLSLSSSGVNWPAPVGILNLLAPNDECELVPNILEDNVSSQPWKLAALGSTKLI